VAMAVLAEDSHWLVAWLIDENAGSHGKPADPWQARPLCDLEARPNVILSCQQRGVCGGPGYSDLWPQSGSRGERVDGSQDWDDWPLACRWPRRAAATAILREPVNASGRRKHANPSNG
jgi:hypothetical protein